MWTCNYLRGKNGDGQLCRGKGDVRESKEELKLHAVTQHQNLVFAHISMGATKNLLLWFDLHVYAKLCIQF